MYRLILMLLMNVLVAPAFAREGPATQPYLLHLPGIGGHLPIDDSLIAGLKQGGVEGWIELYDWTGTDRGLIALMQEKRKEQQSQGVADFIARKYRDYPGVRITLTSHSGG